MVYVNLIFHSCIIVVTFGVITTGDDLPEKVFGKRDYTIHSCIVFYEIIY